MTIKCHTYAINLSDIEVITLLISGLLIKLMIFALLSLAIFGHFDTFSGWVGGWMGGEN